MGIEESFEETIQVVTGEEERRRLEERQQEIETCIQSMGSRNPRFRSKAAERLGELRAGADVLVQALRDPNEFVRAAAAQSLGSALESITPDAVDGLLSCLDDKNDFVCSAAIRTLGRLRAEGCTEELEPFLEDRNPHIISDTLIALGRMNATALIERILPFLEDANFHISAAAAQALASMGYAQAGDRMIARLEMLLDSTNTTRSFSPISYYIDALATLKINAAVPVLTHIARTQVGMRSKAINALMQLDSDDVVPVLLPLLNDPGEKIRIFLLRMIGSRNFRKAAPVVRPLLCDPTVSIRRQALQVLIQLRDRGALDAVRAMAQQDSNPFVRRMAALGLLELAGDAALPDLILLADDTNTLIRQAVALGLSRMGRLTPEAVLVLQRLAQDADTETGATARQALLEHSEPVDTLVPLPPRAQPAPIPPALRPHAADLRMLLHTWQDGLGSLLPVQNIDTINCLDSALQTLLVALNGSDDNS
ncbi:MAG TPA: HEAT repeat domain-containing protein [Anaerolineaceae bacterium]